MNDFELTFLTYQDLGTPFVKNLLEFEREKFLLTDLAILRGSFSDGDFWTSSWWDPPYWKWDDHRKGVALGSKWSERVGYRFARTIAIRLVLVPSINLYQSLLEKKEGDQVSFLEYPQAAVFRTEQPLLKEKLEQNRLLPTGKVYTFDKVDLMDERTSFQGKMYPEYLYQNQKYIYVDNHSYIQDKTFILPGGLIKTNYNDRLFVKVQPIFWWVDTKNKRLISTRLLLSGLQFQSYNETYHSDFKDTFIKHYLDTYMKKELIPSSLTPKSETFDSNEPLKRLIYKRYGKKG